MLLHTENIKAASLRLEGTVSQSLSQGFILDNECVYTEFKHTFTSSVKKKKTCCTSSSGCILSIKSQSHEIKML